MKSIRESYFYASFEGFKILKLPYEICQDNKQFPMHIFLPEKHDGLQELVQNFNSDQSMFLKRISKLSKMSVPKFKFSYGFEASKSMEKLGLKLPFKLVGDFTEMVDSPLNHLVYARFTYISQIFYWSKRGRYRSCCCFLCSYNGWRCKTTLSTTSTSMFYIADHPFIFMVKEEVSYIVLFTGTVRKP